MESLNNLCLVIGINGQDGSYLAESLLSQGKKVLGIGRQKSSKWIQESDRFNYKQLDVSNIKELVSLLYEQLPYEIYHVAAVHGPAGYNYEKKWESVHLVNTISVQAVLEFVKDKNNCRFIYLSSSKAFGTNLSSGINENSPRKSECIYSITKNAATDLMIYYRKKFNLCISILWTFNHESPRRSNDYFIPIIVDCLASSIKDPSHKKEIFSLNFYSDWSDASDLMKLTSNISDSRIAEDFILASGIKVLARDLVKDLFSRFNLDYTNHIIEKESLELKNKNWFADISKVRDLFNYQPEHTISEVCLKILDSNYGISLKNNNSQ